MTKKLFIEAITKIILGIILTGVLIFLPAGTMKFYNGWLLMAALFVPMPVAGFVMMFKNPTLLKRRLNAKEKQKEQDTVVKLSGIMFIFGFIIAGLDYRFGWSNLPKTVVVIAVLVFLLSYLLYGEVIRENEYLSRTIEVADGQKVIDKGLYGFIRHPMYLASVFMFLSMPVIPGSAYLFIHTFKVQIA